MIGPYRLPHFLQHRLETASRDWLYAADGLAIDFARPVGEAALVSADSVSWHIFKNPVALLIGGIAAVLLELAEPAVRAGVWQHSNFKIDPLRRLQRTGHAAMITVYGPRSIAEPMIARIVQMHTKIAGVTPYGLAYSANDGDLLTWVHATAAYGFAGAYSRYVERIACNPLDQFYLEGMTAARLYGAKDAPRSSQEMRALFATVAARLEPSPILFQFLEIVHRLPLMPDALVWLQPSLIRAAVGLIPTSIRNRLGLDARYGPSGKDRLLASLSGLAANRVMLPESPAVQSCLRLGLPANHLYR